MGKDWVGGTRSVYGTLAANNHSDVVREENDYYATDPEALELLLQALERDNIYLKKDMWEPACGEGHLSEVLYQHGYRVLSTDIKDRGYYRLDYVDDFLNGKSKATWYGDILTNPPYKYAEEFAYKGMQLIQESYGSKLIMFLKIQFLEGQSRYEMFQKYPPKYIYVHSSRQACAIDGKFFNDKGVKIGSAVCYAWFIWETGFTGDPVIRWIK